MFGFSHIEVEWEHGGAWAVALLALAWGLVAVGACLLGWLFLFLLAVSL
jgi:hypothetical protein